MSVGELVEREERPAFVAFERRAVENKRKSLEEGRYIADDINYVLVTPPYSRDCYEERAETWLEKQKDNVKKGRISPRFYELWKESYERWKEGLDPVLDGTDIREWSAISPAEAKNLFSMGIRTIEDLAQANDQGIRRIGMGGATLKNKAAAYIKGSGDTGKLAMENAQLKKDIEVLKGSLESLQNQMSKMGSDNIVDIDALNQRIDAGITASDIIEKDYSSMSFDELKTEYIKKFGRAPHHKAKEKKIISDLMG